MPATVAQQLCEMEDSFNPGRPTAAQPALYVGYHALARKYVHTFTGVLTSGRRTGPTRAPETAWRSAGHGTAQSPAQCGILEVRHAEQARDNFAPQAPSFLTLDHVTITIAEELAQDPCPKKIPGLNTDPCTAGASPLHCCTPSGSLAESTHHFQDRFLRPAIQ